MTPAQAKERAELRRQLLINQHRQFKVPINRAIFFQSLFPETVGSRSYHLGIFRDVGMGEIRTRFVKDWLHERLCERQGEFTERREIDRARVAHKLLYGSRKLAIRKGVLYPARFPRNIRDWQEVSSILIRNGEDL